MFPDIFESATFSFRTRLPSTRIQCGRRNFLIRKRKSCGFKNIRTRVDGALRPVYTGDFCRGSSMQFLSRFWYFKIARVSQVRFFSAICRRDIVGISNMFKTWYNFSATKIESSCRDKNRPWKRAFSQRPNLLSWRQDHDVVNLTGQQDYRKCFGKYRERLLRAEYALLRRKAKTPRFLTYHFLSLFAALTAICLVEEGDLHPCQACKIDFLLSATTNDVRDLRDDEL